MEKGINQRLLNERVKEKVKVYKQDVKRKTFSVKSREAYNQAMKRKIDFGNAQDMAFRLKREGDIKKLSGDDRFKLSRGSRNQKLDASRYGLDVSQISTNEHVKAEKTIEQSQFT